MEKEVQEEVQEEKRGVAFDPATFTEAIAGAVEKLVDARSEKKEDDVAMPEVMPEGKRSSEARVKNQRDVDGKDGVNVQTHRLFRAIARKDYHNQTQTLELMQRAGMYDGAPWGTWQGEQRAIPLTSSEGAPFLPVSVDNRIEEIREEYGAARRLATVYNFNSGTHKVPNTSGRPDVFAVNEGSDIKMRKATWGSVTLDPLKWGLIRSYSAEMSDEVGAQWVTKVTDQVGRAFAEMEDKTVLTADGTATYHSLDGLTTVSGVTEHTLSAGNTSFNNWAYQDGLDVMQLAAAGNRSMGTHIIHPDLLLTMAGYTDAGGFIYPPNEVPSRLVYPVVTTEAMPSIAADAVSTVFHVFGDFSFINIGIQRGIEVKLLDQATILDTDDSTQIRLGSMDALALRFTARWDVKYSADAKNVFARTKTAAA